MADGSSSFTTKTVRGPKSWCANLSTNPVAREPGSLTSNDNQPPKAPGPESIVFAPPAAENHPLKVTQFRAWRVKEPVSNRRYTVVRLQSQGGALGYGEGGPTLGRGNCCGSGCRHRPSARRNREYIRAALRGSPALEAAVNNAMLDLVSRAKNVPIYRYLGGPVRLQGPPAWSSGRCNRRRIRTVTRTRERARDQAFTIAAPTRDAMIPLRAYVDLVRQQYADMQAFGGRFGRMGSRRSGRDDTGRCGKRRRGS